MKKFFALASLVAISLTACSLGKHHNISEYILDKSLTFNEEKGEFTILQLTDIHLGDKDNQDLHLKFMDLTVKDANPDLIVVTGDVFTFAGKATAQRLFGWLDSKGVPWTVTWGNHDEQCYFSVDWMTGYLNEMGSNCYFKDIQDDDIQGNSNFAINLNKGGKLFEQIIVMDSNRYDFNPGHGLYYDAFKQNQIDWYSELVDYTAKIEGAELNAQGVVESLMFYHIPLPEINDAYEANKAELDGVKNETTCPPDYNTGFFKVIKDKGSTHAMFYGHDHINDFRAEYQGVLFAYGVKATSSIYSQDDLLGGQTIKIKADHSLQIDRIFHTYAEVK